jgi:hypothetical protein
VGGGNCVGGKKSVGGLDGPDLVAPKGILLTEGVWLGLGVIVFVRLGVMVGDEVTDGGAVGVSVGVALTVLLAIAVAVAVFDAESAPN